MKAFGALGRSLRWRLLLGAAAAILAALMVAWLLMTLLFERHLERRLEAELTRDGERLVAALVLAPGGRYALPDAPLADPRLLTPASGFYWQVTPPGEAFRSRSLWDADLPGAAQAPVDGWRLRRTAGPFDAEVFVLERAVEPDAAGPRVLIQLAQEAADVTTARDEFGRELALFLALLWLVLSAAAWLQVRLGLQPLARIRDDVAALHSSAAARLPERRLAEVQPLTEAINALADARERDLEQARRRAGDLAHGMKTPLSALAAQSRRAREAGAADAAEGLDRAIAALRRAVEAELARARAAAIRSDAAPPAPVRPTVERLITVLKHTDRGEAVAFLNRTPPNLTLAVRPEDLSEMLGAVLENAVRYARGEVRVSGSASDGRTVLTVEDDGPGIDADRAAEAFARGARLDETAAGSGLGLAIARELVEASGGIVRLSRGDAGGLRVEFLWGAGG